LVLLRNTGDGFVSSTIWRGRRAEEIVPADLNGDGREDLVITGDRGRVEFWRLLQQRNGRFSARAFTVPKHTAGGSDLAVLDVNGDGRPDVVAQGGGGELIYSGDGKGGFASPTVLSSADGPASMIPADVNGDGRKDLVIASDGDPGNYTSVEVLLREAGGGFASPEWLSMPYGATQFESYTAVAAGDLNGDGLADVVAADETTGNLVVFRQTGSDTTPPTTTITGGPSGDASSTATFTFSSNEPGGFVCSINGGSFAGHVWTPCTSPQTYTGLAGQTTWNFSVAAVDRAGNMDPNPVTRSFTVAQAAPSADPPANDDFDNAETLTGDAGAVYGDTTGATFQPGEPYPIPQAGYRPVSRTVWFQWVAPQTGAVTFDTSRSGFVTTFGVYTGSALTDLSSVASNSGSGNWTATFDAAAGTHYFIQLDGSTNYETGATQSGPYGLTWSLNGAAPPPDGPPNTTVTAGPPSSTLSPSATFDLTGSKPGSIRCSVDGGTFVPCTSPAVFTGFAPGKHTLKAQAVDIAGTVDPSPAVYTWTVSRSGPTPTCKVPNTVGKPLKRARRAIERAQCRVGTVAGRHSARKRGIVVSQTRRPGKEVPSDTRINLVISLGRKR